MIDIKTLRAAGLTDSQIVKVLELEQSERQATRREQNRINQQNHRARQHVSTDRADTKRHIIESKQARVRKKTSIPDDFKPVVGPNDRDEFERFKNYCKANGKTYLDWDAAWRNWIISPYRKTAGQPTRKIDRHVASKKEIDEQTARHLRGCMERTNNGTARQITNGPEIRDDTDLGVGWPDNVEKLRFPR
jgi:hypothetical protein